MEIIPPEEDNDDEVTESVRLVLEKNKLIDPSRIRVTNRDYMVTLEGLVGTENQKMMIENDAWYIFGVDQVINKLETQE